MVILLSYSVPQGEREEAEEAEGGGGAAAALELPLLATSAGWTSDMTPLPKGTVCSDARSQPHSVCMQPQCASLGARAPAPGEVSALPGTCTHVVCGGGDPASGGIGGGSTAAPETERHQQLQPLLGFPRHECLPPRPDG